MRQSSFGTVTVWTGIFSRNQLTYFRVGFDSDKEPEPELALVARRLDGAAPLVWADKTHGVKFSGSNAPSEMAMMTGIGIPTTGCWEISTN